MAEAPPKIELVLGDSARSFRRWTEVGVQLRLDTVADAFSFTHVDQYSPGAPQAEAIADSVNEFDRVRVKVRGKTVIDGLVDTVHLSGDAPQGPMVKVTGRSMTGLLVKCAAIHETGQWEDAAFGTIAAQICKPFGIAAKLGDQGAGPAQLAELSRRSAIPFRRVAIEPGETAHAFLLRLAQERGLTLTCTPEGDLAYTIAGIRKVVGKLEEGVNIGPGGSRTADGRDRFQSYRVFGQSAGDDAWHGDKARGGDATVEDDGVPFYCPTVIVSDGTASNGHFEERATWERNRRAARSRRATLPALSWLDPERNVWAPNRLIDVVWPKMRVEGEVLIEAVRLSFELEEADVAELDIVHPGAYDPLQAPKTRRNRRLWADWSAA